MPLLPTLLLTLARHERGDPVSLLRRTQHGGQRTQWAEVPHSASPRFFESRTMFVDALPEDVPEDEPYKVAFALLSQQFETPWMTISDGAGRFLDHLRLTITASGNTVTAVRWEEEHRTGGSPPHSVPIHVTWEHALHEDAASALGLLLGLVALALLVLMCRTVQKSARDDGWAAAAAAGVAGDDGGQRERRSRPPPRVDERKYM